MKFNKPGKWLLNKRKTIKKLPETQILFSGDSSPHREASQSLRFVLCANLQGDTYFLHIFGFAEDFCDLITHDCCPEEGHLAHCSQARFVLWCLVFDSLSRMIILIRVRRYFICFMSCLSRRNGRWCWLDRACLGSHGKFPSFLTVRARTYFQAKEVCGSTGAFNIVESFKAHSMSETVEVCTYAVGCDKKARYIRKICLVFFLYRVTWTVAAKSV